jgi:hypothetical protein
MPASVCRLLMLKTLFMISSLAMVSRHPEEEIFTNVPCLQITKSTGSMPNRHG